MWFSDFDYLLVIHNMLVELLKRLVNSLVALTTLNKSSPDPCNEHAHRLAELVDPAQPMA